MLGLRAYERTQYIYSNTMRIYFDADNEFVDKIKNSDNYGNISLTPGPIIIDGDSGSSGGSDGQHSHGDGGGGSYGDELPVSPIDDPFDKDDDTNHKHDHVVADGDSPFNPGNSGGGNVLKPGGL